MLNRGNRQKLGSDDMAMVAGIATRWIKLISQNAVTAR
jgi:hypothetical protein